MNRFRTRRPTLERLEQRFALDGMGAGLIAEASTLEEGGNSVQVASPITATAITHSIPLAGSVPQQIVISERMTGALAWDYYWHYSSTLDAAPNGVSQIPDGSYLIADTDNSRVVYVSRTGQILAELMGFNSPTNVAWIPIAADLLPPVLGVSMGK